jgi:hypothetical protein
MVELENDKTTNVVQCLGAHRFPKEVITMCSKRGVLAVEANDRVFSVRNVDEVARHNDGGSVRSS